MWHFFVLWLFLLCKLVLLWVPSGNWDFFLPVFSRFCSFNLWKGWLYRNYFALIATSIFSCLRKYCLGIQQCDQREDTTQHLRQQCRETCRKLRQVDEKESLSWENQTPLCPAPQWVDENWAWKETLRAPGYRYGLFWEARTWSEVVFSQEGEKVVTVPGEKWTSVHTPPPA